MPAADQRTAARQTRFPSSARAASDAAIRVAPDGGLRRRPRRDLDALSRRDPRKPHLDIDLPAGRAGDCGTGQCRHRLAGVHGGRPAAARHNVLAARFARRCDLAEGSNHCAVRCRDVARHSVRGARAGSPGFGRNGSVPHGRRGGTPQALCHRAGVRNDRCGRIVCRRDRVCRNCRAAPPSSDHRTGHRLLLPASICLGAILLLVADTSARTLAAPAEVPIGILTALVGAPFFLAVLLRQRTLVGL